MYQAKLPTQYPQYNIDEEDEDFMDTDEHADIVGNNM